MLPVWSPPGVAEPVPTSEPLSRLADAATSFDDATSARRFRTLPAMAKDDDEEKSANDKQNEQNIEIWKIKKLIKSLQAARG